MFSRDPKYGEAADPDEDDDSVDGVTVPEQRRQSITQPAPARPSTASSQTRLDYFFPRQQQHTPHRREQTPQQQPQPQADGAQSINQRKRRAREPSIDFGDEPPIFSSDEEDAPARKPQSRPFSSASRNPNIVSQSGSTASPARPFSKSEFLKKFESDASSHATEEEEDNGGETEGSEDLEDLEDQFMWEEDGLSSPGPSEDIGSSTSLSFVTDSQASGVDDQESDIILASDDEEGPVDELTTPKKRPAGNLELIENTPRRSMTGSQPVGDPRIQKIRLQLETKERETRERILREAKEKDTKLDKKRTFDIIVITHYLINPDEWEAIAIDSRWTSDDGQARYKIIYKDGHSHTVSADHILKHVSPNILEDFEHNLFEKEENPETYYYPNFKAPGGCFAGGTAVTSGLHKRRGRRSDAKIYLDNCFRLVVEPSPQPVISSQLSGSQYDKFDVTDAEILASIRENSSDNESWDGNRKKPTRGRPRGRVATSGRGTNTTRGTNSVRGPSLRARASTASRGPGRPPIAPSRGSVAPTRAATRGRPPLVPSRGSSTPQRGRPPLAPTRGASTPQRGRPRLVPARDSSTSPDRGSNVVKASTTSRGRGRPRGSKLLSMRDTSSQDSASPRILITAPDKRPGVRGRPKGSKNLPKPVSVSSNMSDTSVGDMSIASPSPQEPRNLPSKPPPPTLSSSPNKKPHLTPTRASKPSPMPSGARGPGRPPKSPKILEREDDLVEATIRTAGANITSGKLLAPPPARSGPERPKKRRRIRIGSTGPEEHIIPYQSSPPRPPTSNKPKLPYDHHPKKSLHHSPSHEKPNKIQHHKSSTPTKNTHNGHQSTQEESDGLDINEVINKMFIDGTTLYEVIPRDPRNGNVWVRIEDLPSKDARSKVKTFENRLQAQQQHDADLRKHLYSSISAEMQLEKDKRRVADREAQILSRAKSGSASMSAAIDPEQARRDREREERQRERAARHLAMKETLSAGT
ncbi:hypothetical protein ABW21_db0204295 [Orbilia brochopaga]|nr:hypothetical protein ABW21_db0204295 [Drechslerella brochopaga]